MNKQAILGTFKDGVPELSGLQLVECIITLPRDLLLNVEFGELPKTRPERWKAAGHDRVQLRFRFRDFADLKIVGQPFGATGKMDLTANHMALRFNDDVAVLETSFDSFSVDFQPYSIAKVDGPPVFVRI